MIHVNALVLGAILGGTFDAGFLAAVLFARFEKRQARREAELRMAEMDAARQRVEAMSA